MKIASKTLTILISVLSLSNLYSQSFHERHPTIESAIKKIESTKNYWKKVELSNSEFLEKTTSEGAKHYGYFSENKIQKIICEAYISHGKYENTYYFKNEKLLFVVEIFFQYEYNVEKNEFNYENTELTFMGEYLFEPVFDLETLGHDRISESDIDVENKLRKEAESYLKKLLEKRKVTPAKINAG